MSEVDTETDVVASEFVAKAKKILVEETTTFNLLRNSIREITAYSSNRLPCPAYKILDGSRKLELIGDTFREIADANYCADVVEIKISIFGLDERKKPAASAWIQLGNSFYCEELYLWNKNLSKEDYLVLVGHGTTGFSHQDEELRFTLEHRIIDLLNHKYKYRLYIPF